MRTRNFSAGPSAMPLDVLRIVQSEFLDVRGSGMSVIEQSHRGRVYEDIQREAVQLLRELLTVPDTHDVLLLGGSARAQFALVPANLVTGSAPIYLLTGMWSVSAFEEAKRLREVRIGADTRDAEGRFRHVPSVSECAIDPTAAYVHITSNNTVYGTQWSEFPRIPESAPLVADMTSDILSRPIPIEKFGLIYAGAQKNLGPAGLCVVIARRDLLAQCPDTVPKVFQYRVHAQTESLFNTPPVFSVYFLRHVLAYAKELGGVSKLEQQNQSKAKLLYDALDRHPSFYIGPARRDCRSMMNVVFSLRTPELEAKFLSAARDANMVGLRGHATVGGIRASIYNWVPFEDVEALGDLMEQFWRENG